MKHKGLLFLCILMIFALTTGISFAQEKQPPFNVAFSNVWEGNTWGVQSKAEFYAEVDRQKEAGLVGEVYYANADYSAEKQVSDLEDLLNRTVDILILQPVNPPAVSVLFKIL